MNTAATFRCMRISLHRMSSLLLGGYVREVRRPGKVKKDAVKAKREGLDCTRLHCTNQAN